MNHTGVIKVYLIGTKTFAYRLKFKRAVVPDWVISAMNSIGDRTIGFEDDSGGGDMAIEPEPLEVGPRAGLEKDDDVDQEEPSADLEEHDIDELNDAIRVLEEADAYEEEEILPDRPVTRSTTNPDQFRTKKEAEKYAEYVAMGWREPEAQNIGKVVFNRNFKRTEGNLTRAKETLRQSYLSRHGREAIQEALKTKPKEAWDALLKEVLKGDSKRIWHGELKERKLILPMMKNYIEKSTAHLESLRTLK